MNLKGRVLLDEPGRVYFQDSQRYLFHHSFAVARLAGFEGMTASEFDAVSLHRTGQRLVLGAVLVPSDPTRLELGIQLIGRDPFPIDEIVRWLGWVRQSLAIRPGWTISYFPVFEQGGLTSGEVDLLAERGFPVASPARWVVRDEIYSAGWAFGRLQVIPASDMASAYASGRLRHDDILLADAIPSEIPVVAGVLTLTPGTPNSHVALLSQSLGLPFAYLADAEAQARLRSWHGREILMVADRTVEGSKVQSLQVEGILSEAQRTQLREAQQPVRLNVSPMASHGSLHVAVRDLTPADLRYVGGKAAHFAVLARALPESTPAPALAFTFDLWNAFLDQVSTPGMTLRQRIQNLTEAHSFPPDAARLASDLATIRRIIRDESDFGADTKAEILSALAVFPAGAKIRFRSSTNVEDSEQFSGAGLYDSYSGCVLDDLDADADGPSHCDRAEAGERGVFRALRRVFASFYNDQAYMERWRRGVDESTVGMAILVHPSFPDEIELANGVATVRVTPGATPDEFVFEGEWVSQAGAVSVSNPEGNARPESVLISRAASQSPKFEIKRGSSLVPLGGTVMTWPGDYERLFELLHSASVEFARGVPGRTSLVLDFEYKRVVPGRLVVKQVREVPSPSATRPPAPFVLNDAARLVVFQHHGKDLYANHRLKSIWQLQSLVFRDSSVPTGVDFFTDLQRHDGTGLRRVADRVGNFSNAVMTVTGPNAEYRWTWPDGPLRGEYRLQATFSKHVNPAQPVPLGDALDLTLTARYAEPQVAFDFDGSQRAVTEESTRLVPLDRLVEGQLQRRAVATAGPVRIEIDYTLAFLKFGAPGIGIFDTKSFPLTRWRGTRITGLTTQPIVLQGEFSQTYDSIRHNFVETFLFEPALEPGIEPSVLAELRAANVRRIRVEVASGFPEQRPTILLWGFDDRLRAAR